MLVARGLMAAEQSALDSKWKTACLHGLQQLPWHEWVAAVIAGLKDEDFLVKRRLGGAAGKGSGKDRKEDEGA